jgi:predicted RNA-binding protein Jag
MEYNKSFDKYTKEEQKEIREKIHNYIDELLDDPSVMFSISTNIELNAKTFFITNSINNFIIANEYIFGLPTILPNF